MIQVYKYKPYYEWKQELLWEYNDWYEDYLVFRITHNFDKQEILDKAKKQRELKNLEEKFNLHKKINAIWIVQNTIHRVDNLCEDLLIWKIEDEKQRLERQTQSLLYKSIIFFFVLLLLLYFIH